jgi:Tol biopolymer transport system component
MDGNSHIYVMNKDGSSVKKITNNGTNNNQAAWLKIHKQQ